ncbi:MAG TPA: hypothetical protein VFZ09_31060 [Archangium sp.]|uniref:hypothetical protein n=1 Tax=Archangium sp. TaxID=1872627 RepID=UPI002E34BA0A|nr:hypothetical protein [Archangium sp.]HEX5750708.1 hypothetical protein [Archangium sp.]
MMGRDSYASTRKREAKEQERQNQLRLARESAEQSDARIEELKSAHKACSAPIDWRALAASLPPAPVTPTHWAERSADRRTRLLSLFEVPSAQLPNMASAVAEDSDRFHSAQRAFQEEVLEQADSGALAQGILQGDSKSYRRVLQEISYNSMAPPGGIAVDFEIHSPHLVEAKITAQGSAILPPEVQTLTSTGKLSTKAMPRIQFVELYQDYVCSLVLRVAREVHALLPVKAVLITAYSADGLPALSPVLSTIIHRKQMEGLPFDTLDPSDALDGLQTRTNFKASRRTGAFQPIVAFSPSDVLFTEPASSLQAIIETANLLLEELE